jgi:hypothetical protein
MVPVEQLHSGDQVVLPRLGDRPVLRVDHFDDVFVVIYADSALNCWENKAQNKSGWRIVSGSFEKGLRPVRAGELVPTRRLVLAEDLEEGVA